MIKWSLQEGFICIPKSSNRARISENFNVFDFEIAGEDMQTLVMQVSKNSANHAVSFFCAERFGSTLYF